MDEDKTLIKAPIADDFHISRPNAYDMLMRQSRKLGGLATRTYDVTKEFLKQDVSAIHPDRIMFGLRGKDEDHVKTTSERHPQPNDDHLDTNISSKNEKSDDLPDSKSKSLDLNEGDDAETKAERARVENSDREGGEREGKTLDPRDGLKKIVRKSHQLLASAQSVVLPMNLFPDSVTVDRTKVTITKRTFFWSSSVISIRIEDVLNVGCSTGPIFGSLIISSRIMNSTDHYEINYLWRRDALYLKKLIQGYVIAQHNQIETSHLKRRELVSTLLDLGNDSDY